jgi:hypothetical protein
MQIRRLTFGLSERAKEFIYRIVLEMRVKENIEKLKK